MTSNSYDVGLFIALVMVAKTKLVTVIVEVNLKVLFPESVTFHLRFCQSSAGNGDISLKSCCLSFYPQTQIFSTSFSFCFSQVMTAISLKSCCLSVSPVFSYLLSRLHPSPVTSYCSLVIASAARNCVVVFFFIYVYVIRDR